MTPAALSPAAPRIQRLNGMLHARFVTLLLLSYGAAVAMPGPGLALRRHAFGSLALGSAHVELNAPTVLLAVLLFNASLGARVAELRKLAARPSIAMVGVAANTLLPLAFTLVASLLLRVWHDADETQNLLVGLAIVGAMPIAGSSSAWAQSADGNLALSLGLVLASTLLSPLLTPLLFRAVAGVTTGDYAEDLRELAGGDTQFFLVLAVIVPSLLALLVRGLAGARRIAAAMPYVKLVNLGVLLVLSYANGAVALPQLLRSPDYDYLALLLVATASLCALGFWSGDRLGARLRAGTPERTSLMFALGMSNNGSGLVLASTAMVDHPNVLLTIVVYNLVQQLAAGFVDHALARRERRETKHATLST